MTDRKRPLIGVTLDSEAPGGYSKFPWYAVRQNYMNAIAQAGGLPMALPNLPELAEAMLEQIDGLVITGGAFDVDPMMYGDADRHGKVTLKEGRPNWPCCVVLWRVTCRCWGFAVVNNCSPWR